MKYLLWCLVLVCQFAKGDTEIPRAYRVIADHYGIPAIVFFSIVMQESGKAAKGKFLPWPWTLNIDEKPYYYATREEAELALLNTLDKAKAHGEVGKVAVGLGQIYMPAHISNFKSPLQALDPTFNLNYAAQLLLSHYLETVQDGNPNWWIAVGRYHSPYRESPARAYRQLIFKRCQKISDRCSAFGKPDYFDNRVATRQ